LLDPEDEAPYISPKRRVILAYQTVYVFIDRFSLNFKSLRSLETSETQRHTLTSQKT